ncbi:MAG: hypothetical protein IPK19_27955 [Chloroflexi bacterium]|nr:hypothetical protein [Chloroflexota bacterium]
MSDSEVLTVALVGAMASGVRGTVSEAWCANLQQQGRQWLPQMLGRSAFNERVRHLCTDLAALQQAMAEQLSDARNVYEGDGLPLPVCGVAGPRQTGHWLGATASRGHGGDAGRLVLRPALLDERDGQRRHHWLVGRRWPPERALVAGSLPQYARRPRSLAAPAPDTHPRALRARPPHGFIGGFFAAGHDGQRPYLADQGLNSLRRQQHWADGCGSHRHYAAAHRIPPPATPGRGRIGSVGAPSANH